MSAELDDVEPKIIGQRALAMKVLAVATAGEVGDWSAYIDAVPGKSHSQEAVEVARKGVKLDKRIAAILFPDFNIKSWRD
jgi:hypothetical protein